MTDVHRLLPGTYWENQWTGETVEVLEVDLTQVRARRVDNGDEKTHLVEHFMKTYTSAS